jgi:hypothetical protein
MRYLPVLIVTMSLIFVANAGTDDKEPVPAAIQALLSPDPQERLDAGQAVLAQRKTLVEGLLKTIRNGGNLNQRETQYIAASILGEMRAPEAIPVLVERLGQGAFGTFRATVDSLDNQMAFRAALIKIGHPAIPALIAELRKAPPSDTSSREYSMYGNRHFESLAVIYNILGGRDGGYEKFNSLLDRHIASETNKKAKERLEDAKATLADLVGQGNDG